MATVILLCGAAGSGKTRYARALEDAGARRLSYDEEYWARGYRGPHPVPAPRAQEVKDDLDRQLEEVLGDGSSDVVLDYSFSTRAMREEYRAIAARFGASTRLVHLTAPVEVLLARVAARNGSHANDAVLAPEVVRAYAAGFEVPGPDEEPEIVRTG